MWSIERKREKQKQNCAKTSQGRNQCQRNVWMCLSQVVWNILMKMPVNTTKLKGFK